MVYDSEITLRQAGDDWVEANGEVNSFKSHGSMSGLALDLDPRIDLTKPILAQAERLAAQDRKAEAKAKRLADPNLQPPAPISGQAVDPAVLIRGYGALRDSLVLPDDIDWTEPIYEQVLARERRNGSQKVTKSSAA